MLSLAAGLQTDQSQLMGAFSSVFGPQNLAVLVWRHRDIDRAAQVSGQLQTSPAGMVELVVISDLMLSLQVRPSSQE